MPYFGMVQFNTTYLLLRGTKRQQFVWGFVCGCTNRCLVECMCLQMLQLWVGMDRWVWQCWFLSVSQFPTAEFSMLHFCISLWLLFFKSLWKFTSISVLISPNIHTFACNFSKCAHFCKDISRSASVLEVFCVLAAPGPLQKEGQDINLKDGDDDTCH